jgi:hypothetical protein
MTFGRPLMLCGLAAMLAGCASMPPETRAYYFPQALTKLVVTQTVGCSDDNKMLVSVASATPTMTYVADASVPPASISYADAGGFLKDPDVGVTSTQDGRLTGINATSTGEASTIIKDVASIAIGVATHGAAGAIAGGEAGGGVPGHPAPESPVEQNCKALAALVAPAKPAADGSKPPKTITLTYSVGLTYGTDSAVYDAVSRRYSGGQLAIDPGNNPDGDTVSDGVITLLPDASSLPAWTNLTLIQGQLQVTTGAWWSIDGNAGWDAHPTWSDVPAPAAPEGYRQLKLNRVANVEVLVRGPGALTAADGKALTKIPTTSVWEGAIQVPLHLYYPILVPKGTPFGQQSFALALSDAGSITKLEYGTKSGAADALSTVAAVNKALPTAETKAAELQYQSDLIYQQQRLVACQLDPTKCTGK